MTKEDVHGDAKRIYFISELMVFWSEHPDWRFGQMIMNLSREFGGFADIWEWDIKEFEERINKYRREHGTNNP